MGPEEKKQTKFYVITDEGNLSEIAGEIREINFTSYHAFEHLRNSLEKFTEESKEMTMKIRKLENLLKTLGIKRKVFADIRRRESWKRQHMRKIKKKSAAR